MEDSNSGSVDIEKLSDSNFHTWNQKIVLVLALRDLDKYIEDPPPSSDLQSDILSKWKRGDRKGRALIG